MGTWVSKSGSQSSHLWYYLTEPTSRGKSRNQSWNLVDTTQNPHQRKDDCGVVRASTCCFIFSPDLYSTKGPATCQPPCERLPISLDIRARIDTYMLLKVLCRIIWHTLGANAPICSMENSWIGMIALVCA